MLHTTADILESRGIEYVLEAGTLLGIVREGRLLPWDNDVDITITEDYEEKLLRSRWHFLARGLRLRVKRYKQDTGPFKKGQIRIFKVRKGIFKSYKLVDIFIKRRFDDHYFWTVAVKNPVLKSVPHHFYDQRTWLEWDGRKFMVPADYEGYLECHYGDWRTPVKKWDYRHDDQNVVKKL